jgi:hypothetical protein
MLNTPILSDLPIQPRYDFSIKSSRWRKLAAFKDIAKFNLIIQKVGR